MLTTTFRGQLSTRSRGDHAHYYFSDHFLLNSFSHLGLGHDTYMQKPEIINTMQKPARAARRNMLKGLGKIQIKYKGNRRAKRAGKSQGSEENYKGNTKGKRAREARRGLPWCVVKYKGYNE